MRLAVVLVYLLFMMCESVKTSNEPRKRVFFQDMILKQFESVNLSSLMIREDIGQLVVGAKEKVFVLSLDDINEKTSEANWESSSEDKRKCRWNGKNTEECNNYIRLLHTMKDGNMLVCGTNAYKPECDYMSFKEGKVSFQGNTFIGTGRLPFDPYTRFASLLDGDTLFSASTTDFRGIEVYLQKREPKKHLIKNEARRSWLYNPKIISLSLVEASKNSQDGEDDNVFLFFTENDVEERNIIQVSRIARVCKSDLGGDRTLIDKWTTFLKARLDCPFGDVGSPTLVQDVFLVRSKNINDSIFYATFTSNTEPSGCNKTAVCAYKLSDIRQVFNGRFLTELSHGIWDIHRGSLPFPYPGSCINNEMRARGIETSHNFPDKTLEFVRNHPLMEGVVTPITGQPLLVQKEKRFSKIVVDEVTSLDGRQHQVMFIATDSGWLQKAVWVDSEDARIIEELQVFPTPQPINFLQLSIKTGQLYGSSNNVAFQINVRDCSRYTSCDDCLLARDPYCGWDLNKRECASVVGASTESMIQSLTYGDIRMCPTSFMKSAVVHLNLGAAQLLPCSPETNLPVSWRFSNSRDFPGPQHIVLSHGLVIRPSFSDAGIYTCETMETVQGKVHRKIVVQYAVQIHDTIATVSNLKMAVITLASCLSLLTLILCSFCLIILRNTKQEVQAEKI